MSYHKTGESLGGYSSQNYQGLIGKESSPNSSEFYEFEPAVVLDVIVDETHPQIQKNSGIPFIKKDSWPLNYKNEVPKETDIDFTWIGRILIRMLYSQKNIPQEELKWVKPLNISGINEIPLVGEVVVVVKYMNELYYTHRLNTRGFVNNSLNFALDAAYGLNKSGQLENGEFDSDIETRKKVGPESIIGNPESIGNYKGVAGNYFLANSKIRNLRKKEGDTAFESRFGQSIRFTSYDNIRTNDVGEQKNTSYIQPHDTSGNVYGFGNPTIIIRNRQRPLATDQDKVIHRRLPPIKKITDSEKNSGGIIEEDINHDGTSIYITSGKRNPNWRTPVYKSMFSKSSEISDVISPREEQPKYSPDGSSQYVVPVLNGEQFILNSDRLIFSARFGEIFNISKKRISSVTDGEYTIDADSQIVLTTNDKTVINSPAIYLGQYNETGEPALLGQTTVNILYKMCNWMLAHTHWYKHSHPDAGEADPDKTQKPVEVIELEAIRDSLHTTLSRRVFITGGGFAPGADGVSPNGTDVNNTPTKINIKTGQGVSGGFFGQNYRK